MKNMRHIFFMTVVMLVMPVLTISVHAADDELPHPITLDKGTVKEILKSDMIMLDNDKRYKLENILIPPFEDPPVIDELKSVLLNKAVTVYTYHDTTDKYGIPQAQIVTDGNVWIQEDIVSKGLAWAFSTDTSQQMAHALKMVEDSARAQKLGFWKNPIYAVKTPTTVKKFMNSYQVVEGKILSVNIKPLSGTTFLNFGKNWKTDFVVRIRGENSFLGLVKDPKAIKKVKDDKAKEDDDDDDDEQVKQQATKAVFIPQQWQDRVVRVRGWVHGTTGPVIDVTEKEQIDFVDPDADIVLPEDK